MNSEFTRQYFIGLTGQELLSLFIRNRNEDFLTGEQKEWLVQELKSRKLNESERVLFESTLIHDEQKKADQKAKEDEEYASEDIFISTGKKIHFLSGLLWAGIFGWVFYLILTRIVRVYAVTLDKEGHENAYLMLFVMQIAFYIYVLIICILAYLQLRKTSAALIHYGKNRKDKPR